MSKFLLFSKQDYQFKAKTKYDEIRYLPTLVGAIAPLSIILSVPSLDHNWLSDTTVAKQDYDIIPAITICTSLGIIFQILACIALLLRFWEIRIVLNTFLFIYFSIAHVGFSGGPVINYFLYMFRGWDELSYRLLAVSISSILSLISVIFLVYDYYTQDCLRRKGSGVTNRQRMLVIYAMMTSLWAKLGAIVFSGLEGWSFLDSVYFTLVTNTTIGFGDIVPKLISSRIILFFYSIVGVILMGLLINSIRIVILENFESMFLKKMKKLENFNNINDSEETLNSNETPFDYKNASFIRKEKREELNKEKWHIISYQLLFSILCLLSFWFVGALIFKYIEDWTYFEGVYFCFVSFMTIGYGDVLPKTDLGRVVFIGYALLGLVAAAYAISVGTEMSTLFLDKRIEKINLKYKLKVEEDNEWGLDEELSKLLKRFKTDITNKDELLMTTMSLCTIYQKLVGLHIADQEGTLTKDTLERKEFMNLEQYHLLFCILLQKYKKTLNQSELKKYEKETKTKLDAFVGVYPFGTERSEISEVVNSATTHEFILNRWLGDIFFII